MTPTGEQGGREAGGVWKGEADQRRPRRGTGSLAALLAASYGQNVSLRIKG